MSVIRYEKSVAHLPDVLVPEVFEANAGSRLRPTCDFIVSKNKDSVVLSRYGDDIWDFSPYATAVRPKPILDFQGIYEKHRADVKWIIFCLDRICESINGVYSINTLRGYVICLKQIALYCTEKNMPFLSWFNSESHVLNYLDNHSATAQKLKISALFIALIPRVEETGVDIIVTKAIKDRFTEAHRISRQFRRQHPIIPSRILFGLLSYCKDALSEHNVHAKSFEAFYKTIPVTSTYSTHNETWFLKYLSRYAMDTNSYEILDYFKAKEVLSKRELNRYVSHLDYCARLLLLGYSGMRDGELVALNYDCIEIVNRPHNRVLRLVGFTTKLAAGRKKARWVTSEHVMPAIDYLQSICRVSYDNLKKRNALNSQLKSVADMPLFSKFAQTTRLHDFKQKRTYRKMGFSREYFYARVPDDRIDSMTISSDDYEELKKFDPFRDWRGDGYGVGEKWNITSHQFRRSLAIYSAQSGLISLPALKAQFKHLSQDMTLYYRNNAIEAKKIFDVTEGHFASEYQSLKPEADFFAFIFGTMMNEDSLKGSVGKNYEQLKPKTSKGVTEIYLARNQTIKKFEKGLLSWKETPLGGCMSTSVCTKKLLGSLSVCLTCEDAVIMEQKLRSTIKFQENFLSRLEKNSPEYRAEASELEKLKQMLRAYK